MKEKFLRIIAVVWRHKFGTVMILCCIWLGCLSEHSILSIVKINRQQAVLKREIIEYKDSIRHYQELIDDVSGNADELEHFARERMRMKKQNEDIFLIDD